MKRFISIIFIAVMLISLMGITVFAESSDTITVTFTLPSVGDTILKNSDNISVSLDGATCSSLQIYEGVSAEEMVNINSREAYVDFMNSNSDRSASGTYKRQEYVALFSISSTNITDTTQPIFTNVTGGKVFLSEVQSQKVLYVYFSFTPADSVSSYGESQIHDVYAIYQEGESSTTIYSVDITWGDMKFTYTDESEGTWNPNTHSFDNKKGAAWSSDSNKITVTNHSNKSIEATFAYTPNTEFQTIEGHFFDETDTQITDGVLIETAVNSEAKNAPNKVVCLELTGDLPSSYITETVCGTVTVTIE